MGAYLARRLLALLPTLVLASLIVFVTIRLIPGDVIDLMLSQNDVAADKLSRDQLVAALGMDRPMWEQYLRWAAAIVLHGDLGKSLWAAGISAWAVRWREPAACSWICASCSSAATAYLAAPSRPAAWVW